MCIYNDCARNDLLTEDEWMSAMSQGICAKIRFIDLITYNV